VEGTYGANAVDRIVSNTEFIIQPEELDKLWRNILELDTSTNAITNQMLIEELYENSIGITNKTDPSPISTSTHSYSTECFVDSQLEHAITRIMRMGLPKLTGMSVDELLNLPTYELQMYYRAAVSISKVKSEVIDELAEELDG